MRTIADLHNELEKALDRAEEEWRGTVAQYQRIYEELLQEARELGGGIIQRNEIAAYLGVSEPRVSVLISSGRFRSGRSGFSLADVDEYKKTRKAGRPSRYG